MAAVIIAALLASSAAVHAASQIGALPIRAEQPPSLSAAEMFDWAEQMAAARRFDVAEGAYRALLVDPDLEIRTEARFRLGTIYAATGRLARAAAEFRQILDEKPRASRVRLELARVLDLLGDEAGARRALRAAYAAGLPPEVVQIVDRYSAALRARKPFGASIEITIAPDSNINRATRSDSLGTVLGDFTIDAESKARSGIGLGLRGQAYGRVVLNDRVNLLGRIAGSADIFRRSEFNDLAHGLAVGPEIQLGSDRLTVEAELQWRYLGGSLLSRTGSVGATYFHPLSRQSQLRAIVSIGAIDHRLNKLQDGRTYSASLTYERALSSVMGLGLTLSGDRHDLRDPGYSLTSGRMDLFVYREVGRSTLVGSLGLGRLKADERLLIYPARRADTLYRASFSATFRQLAIRGFAPIARIILERNSSTIEIFAYRRRRFELGIMRAF